MKRNLYHEPEFLSSVLDPFESLEFVDRKELIRNLNCLSTPENKISFGINMQEVWEKDRLDLKRIFQDSYDTNGQEESMILKVIDGRKILVYGFDENGRQADDFLILDLKVEHNNKLSLICRNKGGSKKKGYVSYKALKNAPNVVFVPLKNVGVSILWIDFFYHLQKNFQIIDNSKEWDSIIGTLNRVRGTKVVLETLPAPPPVTYRSVKYEIKAQKQFRLELQGGFF